jgi:hypothetical protein
MSAFGPSRHSGEALATDAKPAYLELIFRPVKGETDGGAEEVAIVWRLLRKLQLQRGVPVSRLA